MNKIVQELYRRSDKLTDYIKEMEDDGANIYFLDRLSNHQDGYDMAIQHLKELIKGGKNED